MRLTALPGGQGQGGNSTNTGTQEDLGYLVLESHSGGLEWHTVQPGFVPKALETHGDLGEMAYAARLELALRGRDGIGKTM